MDLNTRRRQLSVLLKRQLSDFVVAAVPDHPLLMRGPDFLIGGNGLLTAVFSPSKAEELNKQLLYNRLILSRLAMPQNTRNLLLLPERSEGLIGGDFVNDFAAVFEWGDREEINKVARDGKFRGAQREIPKDIRYAANRQFFDIMQITSVMRYLDGRSGTERHSRKIYSEFAEVISFTDGRVKAVEIENKRIDTKQISKMVNNQISKSYSLDSSVPYPSDEFFYGLAIVDDLPAFRSDPDKLIRAAAFGGWAMITERQKESAPDLLKRLSDRREARTKWR